MERIREVPPLTTPEEDPQVRDDLAKLAADEARMEAQSSIDPVTAYLNTIGRIPLLDAEGEVDLSKRIEAGLYAEHLLGATEGSGKYVAKDELLELAADGRVAKEHLITANLRLVTSLAKRYQHRGMHLLDLIQEGNVGLIRAVEKFDYKKGYKFSTYAMWWIRQGITRGLADKGATIRKPAHIVDAQGRFIRAQRDFYEENGRTATRKELCKVLGWSEKKVDEHFEIALTDTVSLNLLTEGGELSDLQGDDEQGYREIMDEDRRMRLLDGMEAVLNDREFEVLCMRTGLPEGNFYTLEEVGKAFGVTRERIRQIEKRALQKVKAAGIAANL